MCSSGKKKWDEESILLAYADWFLANRKIPSHKEIISKGLPPESVIRTYFGEPINFYEDYFSELYPSEESQNAFGLFY